MRILFLSRWFPDPPDNGAKLRILNLLRGLAGEHEVHLLSFADDPAAVNLKTLETFCRSVTAVQWREYQPGSRRALLGLFDPLPRSLVDTHSPEMEQEIRRALDRKTFDLVITSQWQMTAYRHQFAGLPALYEEIEIGVLHGQVARAASAAARLRAGLTWRKHHRYLLDLLSGGQPCTVVSEQEKQLLAGVVRPAVIHVIPNGVALDEYARINETPLPDSLIFTGSFRYRPNHEAMLWFIQQVLPRIQAQVPGVRLTITGDAAGLALPENSCVTHAGFVEDVRPRIARSWVSIAPLQVGGGTRLKILEAMALGTPVVSTGKGAEGLAARHGVHLAIADSADDFARQTVTVLLDAALRERLSVNGRELIRTRYDWRVILPEFLKVVDEAAVFKPPIPNAPFKRRVETP